MKISQSPTLLLLFTGALLGLTFPFGKIASNAGISPLVWAWLVSAGSGVCLLLIRLLSKRGIRISGLFLQYYFTSGVVSLVIPNVLIFSVVPKLGAGFTGLMFTLSPVFTLLLSSIWKVRVPGLLGIAGIALGFAGAVMVALTRGEVSQPAGLPWVLAGLCIPVSLAIGNLYRTLRWPELGEPLELAAGSNLAAGAILLAIIAMHPDASLPGGLLSLKIIAVSTVVASTAMFTLFFRLQQVGGPTYLSQIGYVAAAVALIIGTSFLSERYSLITWAGAVIILAGMFFSVQSQRSTRESA